MSSLRPTRRERALTLARMAHAGQTRKYTGEPYITHPMRVAELVAQRTDSEEAYIAALLHDVVEDTHVTKSDIVKLFGLVVGLLVSELTDVYTSERFPEWNRAKRKRKEAERLGRCSRLARLIKRCDIADNTSDIVENDPTFAAVYLREKADLLFELDAGCAREAWYAGHDG